MRQRRGAVCTVLTLAVVNPGVLVDFDEGDQSDTGWGFSCAARIVLYGVVRRSAVVGEIYGTEGGVNDPVQYRIGLRREPSTSFVGTVPWFQEFDGSLSGGLEVAIIVFSPRFDWLSRRDPDECD